MTSKAKYCLAAAAAMLFALPAAARPAPLRPAAHADSNLRLPTQPLLIREGRRTHRFTVEMARSDQEQEYGLMWRTRVAPYEGMLFPFSPARPASFWMKNTIIPLDMVFIREDGSIARIAARATPRSLAPVQVGEPVVAVLELAGGRAKALGIDEKAHVSWPGGPRP